MSKSRRRFIRYAIVLPSLSFAIVSCTSENRGGDAAKPVSSQSSVETKPDGASTQTSELIKIRIAYPSGMNGQIATTMEKAEIAKKQGLNSEFIFFQYGPPMMEALAAGM
jgi:ABC-type nitrate/sulfonate/bicarbonate transport system substrate-binding protein